jgi:hypothetical protein
MYLETAIAFLAYCFGVAILIGVSTLSLVTIFGWWCN